MGICISSTRRPLHSTNDIEESSSSTSSSRIKSSKVGGTTKTEMLNPARLILDSPRISTDLGEMSMLGMLFHKRYCKSSNKSSSSSTNVAATAAAAAGSSSLEKLDEDYSSPSSTTIMNANALFDQYPTFDLPAKDEIVKSSSDEEQPTATAFQQQHRWVSAGEDFYSDVEDRSTSAAATAAAAELDVFEAEQYFKEDSEAATVSIPRQQEMRCSSASECSSAAAAFRRASSATSAASGMWASCASGSAIEIDEAPLPPPPSSRRTNSRQQLSRMFKLLASHGRNQSTKKNFLKSNSSSSLNSDKLLGNNIQSDSSSTEVRVKDWMDRARNSGADEANVVIKLEAPIVQDLLTSSTTAAAAANNSSSSTTVIVIAPPPQDDNKAEDQVQGGFGSPFPGSPSSESKQMPLSTTTVEPRVNHGNGDGDGGNESDSSSDLFELDSVTTSLSSARSSLSRMSSARSSIRKSTADEQDMLNFKADATSLPSINNNNSNRNNGKIDEGSKNKDLAKRRRPNNISSSSNNRRVSSFGFNSTGAASRISVIEEEMPKAVPLPRRNGRNSHRPWNHSSGAGALAVQT